MLKLLITMPLFGIFLIQIFKKNNISRIIGMLSSILTMYISLYMLIRMNNNSNEYQYREIIDLDYIRITLGVDGISLSLILVTTLLVPILILLKERNNPYEIEDIVKLILIMESMLIFLFTSLDLFFFFLFFELLLIPMFLLIGKYGSKEKKIEAAYRFIGVSMLGSLIMLITLIIIYIKFGTTNNEILLLKFYNFNFDHYNFYILSFFWLSFFLSFAIKVPIFPFHTWLPFVHVEAPTIGSMLLAGIMLKLGTYGIIRYTLSLFGDFNFYFLPIIFIMTILSIVYCSITTIRQIDLKKIIAYSSIVHMNYAILGFYSNEIEGLLGGNYLMISHAFVSCGLFLLVGLLYKRYHSRILLYYGGLVLTMPLYSTSMILLTLANLSLPLTSSFISEILIIIGSFKLNFFVAILISLSLILSTTYGIWFANRLLFGDFSKYIKESVDMTKKEIIAILPLIILTIILGINTKILFNIYSLPLLNLLY